MGIVYIMDGFKKNIGCLLLLGVITIINSTFSGDFPYRQALAPEIKFWKMVFTRLSSSQVLLHDAKYPYIIYKIITFDSTVGDAKRRQEIRKIKKQIQHMLLRLAEAKSYEELSRWEKLVYNEFLFIPGKEKFLGAVRRIRTQQGIRENFRQGLERSYAYLPHMKKVFRAHGLPEELIYIPHLESSFNPSARSHAGAVGMWQFMRRTGRLYMHINRVVDERLAPIISTEAAARLLKENYSRVQDWALAITAYNYGLSGIKKAAKKWGNDYLKIRDNYLHRRFGFASKSFYPEFLAVVEIMDSLNHYFPELHKQAALRFQEIVLPVPVKLSAIAKNFHLDLDSLRKINPAYKGDVWRGRRKVPGGYRVRLPFRISAGELLAYLKSSSLETVMDKKKLGQLPAPGLVALSSETSSIKKRTIGFSAPRKPIRLNKPGVYDREVSSSFLVESIPALESAGMEQQGLFGPSDSNRENPHFASGSGESGLPFSRFQSVFITRHLSLGEIEANLKTQLRIHEDKMFVLPNETLGHIAEWLGISIAKLRRMNRLSRRGKIYTGQELLLDFSRLSVEDFTRKRVNFHRQIIARLFEGQSRVKVVEHKVIPGENLWDLAYKKYKFPVNLLFYFNDLDKLDQIYPGDIIKLPLIHN